MPGIASTEVVVPKNIPEAERPAFIQSLHAVHARVFDGVDQAEFARYVVNSRADRTWIQLFKNDAGEVVGYFALHLFEKTLGGKLCAVFRAEAGMLRRYRGGSSTMTFALRHIAEYKLRHPDRPLYYLGCLVHPSSYTLLARYAEAIWPCDEAPTPSDLQAFMCELGEAFHLEAADPANPLVRKVGWKTRDTPAERGYWQGCQKPAARYFVRTNARYADGNGLLTLVPISARTLATAMARFAHGKGQRRLDTLRARFRPGASAEVTPAQAQKVLQSSPLFRRLGDWDLEHLAQLVRPSRHASGEYVFRRGDPGDAMYVVLSGAAYVLVERDGDETVLDELGPGEVFGEIALLTGEKRSASIRSAGELQLLRLEREPFMKLLASRPDLRDEVFSAYTWRLFRSYLPSSLRFAGLEEPAARAWFQQGRRSELAAGDELSAGPGSYLFLAHGTVDVEGNGGWVSAHGPALLALGDGTRVRSAQDAVVICLPTPPHAAAANAA